MDAAESAVLDNYATVTLPAEVRDRIAARIDEAVTDWAQTRTERATHSDQPARGLMSRSTVPSSLACTSTPRWKRSSSWRTS